MGFIAVQNEQINSELQRKANQTFDQFHLGRQLNNSIIFDYFEQAALA
jgi:hypothetical protein